MFQSFRAVNYYAEVVSGVDFPMSGKIHAPPKWDFRCDKG